MKIKVLIVDDSALIRSVLREIISSQADMEVVGVAPDPIVARDLIRMVHTHVLLLSSIVLKRFWVLREYIATDTSRWLRASASAMMAN